ncbi:MAG: ATP-binding cassette domain-containing protein, partial [Brucella anthropi]
MSAEPMIEVRGLKKSFGEIEVLRNISLTVERGQVVGLIGPSGSGKSTLLRSLNLLSLPDAGYIAIGDQKIDFSSGNVSLKDKYLAAFRANTGMVFQNFNL